MQTALTSAVIRVALVEDDVNFQNCLKEAIVTVSDMVLVKLVGTRALGLKLLEGERPDVLLVDIGLPDGSGVDVIRAVHQQWPQCNIMVSTSFGDENNVLQSLEAGASGYLLKDSEPEKLVAEIRSLHAGGSPISPLIARQLISRFRHDAAPVAVQAPVDEKPRATLSARELEVLEFITKGFSLAEIAAHLSVSHHTVRTYVRRIYAKLEVNSKTEAVFEARYQGLLGQ